MAKMIRLDVADRPGESVFIPEGIAAEGALVIHGRALLVYLALLAVLSGAAFGAGLAWGKRDLEHYRTINEIAAVQNGHSAAIDELRALQAGIDIRVVNHADSLAALWRCYTSLAKRR